MNKEMKFIKLLIILSLIITLSCEDPLETPERVQNLTAYPGDGKVDLSWTNPEEFDEIQIFSKVGEEVNGPEDVTASLVYNGGGTSFEDSGLNNGTKYFYALFAYKEEGGFSEPEFVSATPYASEGADQENSAYSPESFGSEGFNSPVVEVEEISTITDFSLTTGREEVSLSWINPESFYSVKIYQKVETEVAGPDDPSATLVYEGTDESIIIKGLTLNVLYHFSAYTYNDPEVYSDPIMFSATTSCRIDKTLTGNDGYKLPDTGQTAQSTEFCGQDADYIINPMDFTVVDNGTVIDNNTGLMWEQLPLTTDHIGKNWSGAKMECTNRTTGGYNDWRLPNIIEFATIMDFSRTNPAIDKEIFPNTRGKYWTRNYRRHGTPVARYVDFASGKNLIGYQTYRLYVRCVR